GNGECPQDGENSLDTTAVFDALVPAADCPRAGDRSGDGAELPGVRMGGGKTRHFAPRLLWFKTSPCDRSAGSGCRWTDLAKAPHMTPRQTPLTTLRAVPRPPGRSAPAMLSTRPSLALPRR